MLDRLKDILRDRYRFERELGAGGMATVYLVHDLRHDRQVALKVLRPELAATLGAERFLREINIAARLQHPHILGLIDSGAANGSLYYVMPYVEGESLRERLERGGELPVDEAVRILHEAADALAYAHQRGIIHRDVKPENILLAGRHALIADFGVAKAIHEAAATPALTSTGIALGTPAYMSPEQASADPNVDHRADIYALGVVAYELLTGVPPFSASTAQGLLAAHLTRQAEPLSRLRPSVPPELEHIVLRCLEKRPADRWQSAEDVLRRLEQLAPTGADSPASGIRTKEPVSRTFRLSEDVCRHLNRATLDSRIIGESLHYLDNDVDSDVLVCFLHGTGFDQSQFDRILRLSPYRAVAPTLFGFEATSRRRIVLSLQDHLVIIREFMRDMIGRQRPAVSVVAGISSGGDLALRLVSDAGDNRMKLNGLLSMGCNLSLETCFVTRLLKKVGDDNRGVLDDLRSLGAGISTLHEWLNVHEYMVRTLRKFHDDIAPLRRFSADVVQPFEREGESPFIEWFRMASAHVQSMRCVFEDTDMINRPLHAIRLRNLDEGVLGPHYRDDSIIIEPDTDHFDLFQPERIFRHLDGVVESARQA